MFQTLFYHHEHCRQLVCCRREHRNTQLNIKGIVFANNPTEQVACMTHMQMGNLRVLRTGGGMQTFTIPLSALLEANRHCWNLLATLTVSAVIQVEPMHLARPPPVTPKSLASTGILTAMQVSIFVWLKFFLKTRCSLKFHLFLVKILEILNEQLPT